MKLKFDLKIFGDPKEMSEILRGLADKIDMRVIGSNGRAYVGEMIFDYNWTESPSLDEESPTNEEFIFVDPFISDYKRNIPVPLLYIFNYGPIIQCKGEEFPLAGDLYASDKGYVNIIQYKDNKFSFITSSGEEKIVDGLINVEKQAVWPPVI